VGAHVRDRRDRVQRREAVPVQQGPQLALGGANVAHAPAQLLAAVIEHRRHRSRRHHRRQHLELEGQRREHAGRGAHDDAAVVEARRLIGRHREVDPGDAVLLGADLHRPGRPRRRALDGDERVGHGARVAARLGARARRPGQVVVRPARRRRARDAEHVLDEALDADARAALEPLERAEIDRHVGERVAVGGHDDLERDDLVTHGEQADGLAWSPHRVVGAERHRGRGGVAADALAVVDGPHGDGARGRGGAEHEREREERGPRRRANPHASVLHGENIEPRRRAKSGEAPDSERRAPAAPARCLSRGGPLP
jgi:hypothetical protein